MDENQSVKLLKEHEVRPTANRILIVKNLAGAGHPVSMTDLEHRLHTIDKSVIFRTLTLFKQHHVVHAMEMGNGDTFYELCNSHDEELDDDIHVHFFCESCNQTFCLNDIPVPRVKLPEGFEPVALNYIVKGLCPKCARRNALIDSGRLK